MTTTGQAGDRATGSSVGKRTLVEQTEWSSAPLPGAPPALDREFLPGHRVSWEEFYNKYENIAIKVSKDILDSDEAIVAVMAHEMHELEGLRKIFQERETITAEELGRMINPGHKGNLHDQAWDVADTLVAKMQQEDSDDRGSY